MFSSGRGSHSEIKSKSRFNVCMSDNIVLLVILGILLGIIGYQFKVSGRVSPIVLSIFIITISVLTYSFGLCLSFSGEGLSHKIKSICKMSAIEVLGILSIFAVIAGISAWCHFKMSNIVCTVILFTSVGCIIILSIILLLCMV